MGNQNDHPENRSSALTPEQLAAVNAMVGAAVREVFAALAPVLKDMALTPEKLREANRPYEDPAKIQRELRESLKSKEDEAELARMTAARRANCPHVDKNGRSSINLIHNYPDHQPRGICVTCHDLIHPREWRIGAPDEKNPRGKAYIVEAHKNYAIVLQLESHT